MKKLLVVLLILVAGVLPGMAKECKDYRAAQGDLTSKSYVSYLLWGLIQDNDLKCLEYFVDEVHLNLNDVETRPGTSLIGETLALALSDTKLETVAFILNHGIKPTEGDMDYIARELTKMESQYNWRISNYGDLFLKKFELLTDKYPESLKMVDDYRIGYIIYYSVYSDNPLDLVEFLIDRGLPTIEYDRYISQTNKEMKEIYNNLTNHKQDNEITNKQHNDNVATLKDK